MGNNYKSLTFTHSKTAKCGNVDHNKRSILKTRIMFFKDTYSGIKLTKKAKKKKKKGNPKIPRKKVQAKDKHVKSMT